MHYTYKTKDTCSSEIVFDYENDKITNLQFVGGCNGNLKTIAKFCEGMSAEQVISKCEGVTCGRRPTSCADQLALALKKTIKN